MRNGGRRPGAGRPKGSRNKATLSKEAMREHVQQRIAAMLDPLLDGQLAQAIGRKYLVTRDKRTGKFIRVGPAMAAKSTEETIEVWEADPSTPAFTDLMNRALDKAKDQPLDVNVDATLNVVARKARLDAALAAFLKSRKK